jgi:hypothetical protein
MEKIKKRKQNFGFSINETKKSENKSKLNPK